MNLNCRVVAIVLIGWLFACTNKTCADFIFSFFFFCFSEFLLLKIREKRFCDSIFYYIFFFGKENCIFPKIKIKLRHKDDRKRIYMIDRYDYKTFSQLKYIQKRFLFYSIVTCFVIKISLLPKGQQKKNKLHCDQMNWCMKMDEKKIKCPSVMGTSQ